MIPVITDTKLLSVWAVGDYGFTIHYPHGANSPEGEPVSAGVVFGATLISHALDEFS